MRRVAALLLVAAGVAVYLNALATPFVFDDQHAIVDNETIRSLTPLARVLRGPFQSTTAGRPLVNLALAINYQAGGLSPLGYHAVNLALHVLCGLLLFGIVRRTLDRIDAPSGPDDNAVAHTWWAFAIALLWLLHPLTTEVVDYTIQRTESMMALAYFATLYCAVRGIDSSTPARWHAGAIACCAAGMLCKESMATAPVMVLLYDAVFGAGTMGGALRARKPLYAGLGLSWVVLAAMIASGPRANSAGFASGVSPWVYLLDQAPKVLRYIRLAFWPDALVLDYGFPPVVALSDVWPAAVVVVALLALTAIAWRASRPIAFLATWFFVTLAPTSSIVPIATEVAAERRMYLPLAAIVVLIVLGVRRLHLSRTVCVGAFATVSVALALLTVRRNAEYHEPVRLWQTAVDRYPNGGARYGLAMALEAAGRRDESFDEMQRAAADFPDAEYAVGFALYERGRRQEAVTHLERYIALKPKDLNVLRAYNLIGRARLSEQDVTGAAAAFRETLARQPDNTDALAGLGDSLLGAERFDEAAVTYTRYTALVKTDASAFFNLGLALAAQGQIAGAARAWESAVAINPNDPGTHARLADALMRLGRVDEALAHYRRVAELDPDPDVRQEIGNLLRTYGARR